MVKDDKDNHKTKEIVLKYEKIFEEVGLKREEF